MYTADVSTVIPLTIMEVVLDNLRHLKVLFAILINIFRMVSVLAHALIDSILTQQPENVCLALLTVLIASLVHSVSSATVAIP